jgi:(4S)-4-hydroxy-5-phosphonooxypentane-2,3-dione isomerase
VYALIATLHIQREHREEFLASMLDDARGSVNDEPGCYRFDVLVDAKDPNTLYLYEVYRDRAAFDAHLQAPHYVRWRDTVKDWYAAPGQVNFCAPVFPPDSTWTT